MKKILKSFIQMGDTIAYPLSIIANQSLCTGIVSKQINPAKVIPLYKKMMKNYLDTTVPFPCYHRFPKRNNFIQLPLWQPCRAWYAIRADLGFVNST